MESTKSTVRAISILKKKVLKQYSYIYITVHTYIHIYMLQYIHTYLYILYIQCVYIYIIYNVYICIHIYIYLCTYIHCIEFPQFWYNSIPDPRTGLGWGSSGTMEPTRNPDSAPGHRASVFFSSSRISWNWMMGKFKGNPYI